MGKWLLHLKKLNYHIILFCFSCLLVIIACKKDKKPEVPPEINDISISKDTLRQGFQSSDDFYVFSFIFSNQFGEAGFASNSDSILLHFNDLRFPNAPSLLYIVSPNDNNPYIDILNENIEIQVATTCCAFAPDGSPPCTPIVDYFESVSYEVEYLNNFGYEIPKDTFSFVVNCSF